MYIRPPYCYERAVESIEMRQVRWIFLRKVYLSLAIQMLLTVVVASIVVFVQPVANFFVSTPGGFVLYICSLILPIAVLCHLYFFYLSHPVNLISLGAFAVAMSFAVGLTCAFTKGEIILESVILTSAVAVSLTVYTYWAQKHAFEFRCQGPYWEQFLLAVVIILIIFSLIQIFFPLGRISLMMFSGLASLIFCGYIIYHTKHLIAEYAFKEYVWAAIAPYVDIVNLFLFPLTLIRASDSEESHSGVLIVN